MESMRAVGYTLETAIADLIDNSITAGADQIDIRFRSDPEPQLAVVDNGAGMDQDTLLNAMRLAGQPPSRARSTTDLGRFGLGLKTASLSQARSLTVVTNREQQIRAVRWDLDHLLDTGRWSLQILEIAEARALPWFDQLELHGHGTLVIWDRMDQLHATPDQVERQLDELMGQVRDHLGLVFHRFTSATMPPLEQPLALRINGNPVAGVDPFLVDSKGTQRGQLERIKVEDSVITVQPYTLPYINKLKASERRAAQIPGALRDSQGFYVYRAGRLVLWGTWFRLMPRDDLGKLARVQVDVPNSLDHLWALDIKKSSVSPPPEVRRRLAQIAGQIVRPSKRVHQYRGRVVNADDKQHIWNLFQERGEFHYELNREHPLMSAFSLSLDDRHVSAFENLLRLIEATFPVEDAYNRLGGDQPHSRPSVGADELGEIARVWMHVTGDTVEDAARKLAFVDVFAEIDDLEAFLREVADD
jgi:hypothetical protein